MKRRAMKKNKINAGNIIQSILISLMIISQVHFAYAQTASILPPAKTTFFDSNGNPLTSGTVESFIPSTTTHKTTWQDAAETIPNLNPLTLDAAGRTLLLGSGSYRQVVKDRLGNLIWDQVTSSTGSGGSGGSTATGDGDLVGTIKPWAGIIAPNQYMFTYGQTLNRTTFSALFNAITSTQAVFCTSGNPILTGLSDTTNFWIGMSVETSCIPAGFTTIIAKTSSSVTLAVNANATVNTNITFFPWGNGNHSTTFTLPDFRGLIPVGNNIMGGVASSNISDTFFGSQSANSAGGTGGAQSQILLTANVPPHTHSGNTGVESATHTHNMGTNVTSASVPQTSPTVAVIKTDAIGGAGFSAQTGTESVNHTHPFTTDNGTGTSVAFSIIQPSKTINYIIKVTPDANSTTASGVTSLGTMTGDIACGTGLTCTGNTISANAISGVSTFNGRSGAVIAANSDYNAGQITYTPVGTGGVATTVKAELDRIIWVNDYGLVCDGITDDHTAFQNAINQGQTSGRPVRWIGSCAIFTGLSITSSVDFGGFSGGIYTSQTRLVVTSASVLAITVTTANGNPVNLHDFGISYNPVANAGIAAITLTGTAANENAGSVLERLVLNTGIAIGVDFVKASTWRLVNSTIVSSLASGIAVRVANQNNVDSGDSTIYGNMLQSTGGSGNAITWTSSGGLRIENNKLLGISMNQGIQITLASGASTSDIFIIGNSVEGLATSGIGVNLVRLGTTGSLNHVIIQGNEFGGGQVCVEEPVDATGQWLTGLTIIGNNCQTANTGSSIGYQISTTVNGLYIGGGLIWATGAGSNQAVSVGTQTATNCVVGPFVKNGTIGVASTPSSCQTYVPF